MTLNPNTDFSVPVDRQELNVAVYNIKKNIEGLCNLNEKLTVNSNTTPCDIVDLSGLYETKCKMIDNVIQDIKDSKSNIRMTDGEMLIDMYNTLVDNNNKEKQILEHVTNKLEPLEKQLAEMQMTIQQLEMSEKTIKTSDIETPEMLNLNLLQKNSLAKMREVKTKFHSVLDQCFEKTSTKQLIQDLTTAYFQGGDNKYIDISDRGNSLMFDIALLKENALIVEDPYNNMRIKIDDFF